MMPSLGALLPAGCEWEWGDPREPSPPLLVEEEPLMSRAVDKRRREFAKGRACARTALARLGCVPGPLLSGDEREPLWPEGVVGSVTHTDSYCAVAVARSTACAALGIDAEQAEALEQPIADRISTPAERQWLARHEDDALVLARLVFSIKEAVYKCQFPLSRQFLGFSDVVVELDGAPGSSGTFDATLERAAGPFQSGHRFHGRWARGGGLLLAATWI
jgi:4'-phosphopantetheinyl transferase EntD